jgi:hypothetical protein
MGIFDKLSSGLFKAVNKDFYKKGAILGYIQLCESLYKDFENKFPDKDPHEHLVAIYSHILTKSGTRKESDSNDPAGSWRILLFTLKPACLPPHLCARGLAYRMIFEDKELFVEFLTNKEFKPYLEEYNKYLQPLIGKDKGFIKQLYCEYNRNSEHQELLFC